MTQLQIIDFDCADIEFTSFVLKKTLSEEEKNDCRKLFQYLRYGFGDVAYQKFLKHVKYFDLREKSNAFVLVVQSEFVKGMVLQSYFREIASFVYNNCQTAKKIEISVKQIEGTSKPADVLPATVSNDVRMNFDDFICGESNKFAFWSAKQVSEMILSNDCHGISSLCVFGPVGMGKTHLMKSIIKCVKSSRDDCKIEYVPAEDFRDAYIEAVKSNSLFNFKRRFSELDALLIDDAQFICSSTGSLEKEFARILNSLIDNKKWVVIACDKAPSSLHLDSRAKSRISNGLKAGIQAADFDLRLLILKSKLQQFYDAYEIPLHMLEYIAQNVISSIRELESILHNIISYAKVMQVQNIKESLVHEILSRCDFNKTLMQNQSKALENDTVQAVCRFYNIKVSDLLGASRVKKVSRARAAAAYIARYNTAMTLQAIGEMLERKHSTVIYLIGAAKSDSSLLAEIEQILR